MRILLLFIISITLFSCGKIKKNLVKHRADTEITQEVISQEEITTTEKVDTLITLAPDTTEWILPLVNLTDSSTLIVEDEHQIITMHIVPEKKIIRAKSVIKEQSIPVVIDKKTTEKRNFESSVDYDKNTVDTESTKTVTEPLIKWYWWVIAGLIVAGYVYLKYFLKFTFFI